MQEYYYILAASIFVFFFGKNKIIYWLFFIFLLFFYTFRGNDVGGDTQDYYYQYLAINEGTIKDQWHMSLFEFSFYYWTKAIYLLFGSWLRPYWLLSGIFMYGPFFYMSRKTFPYAHRIVSLFVLQYDYLYSWCFLMQYMCIAVLFCGFIHYEKHNDWRKFACFVLFAGTFHSSAFALLGLIPVLKMKIKENTMIKWLILSYLLGRSGFIGMALQMIGITTFYQSHYIIKDVTHFTLNGFFLTIFTCFVIKVVKLNKTYVLISVLGTMLTNLLAFNGDIARIHWDLSICTTILFSCYEMKPQYRRYQSVLAVGTFLYGVLVYWTFLIDNQSKIIPYIYDYF